MFEQANASPYHLIGFNKILCEEKANVCDVGKVVR